MEWSYVAYFFSARVNEGSKNETNLDGTLFGNLIRKVTGVEVTLERTNRKDKFSAFHFLFDVLM